MGVPDVGRLSLGEWTATVRGWNKAHGGDKPAPPSVEEFEAAVIAARGGA